MFKLLDSSSLTHVDLFRSATELSLPNASCITFLQIHLVQYYVLRIKFPLGIKWLRVCTNKKQLAIENKIQQKGLNEYQT